MWELWNQTPAPQLGGPWALMSLRIPLVSSSINVDG